MNSWKPSVITSTDVRDMPVSVRTLSEENLRTSVFKILAENTLCSMATVTSNNLAHISTAYFSYSGAVELYFWSHPHSLHCRNLMQNPSMAVAVFSSSQKWTGPDKGLQLFGTCGVASGAQAKKGERLYAKLYTLCKLEGAS